MDPDNPGQETVCYEYTEHGSKNNHGGLKQIKMLQPNKVVCHFASPTKLSERCFIVLLELYLAKRPEFAIDSSDADVFYLRKVNLGFMQQLLVITHSRVC